MHLMQSGVCVCVCVCVCVSGGNTKNFLSGGSWGSV